MNKISLLGVSEDSIAVIFDLVNEFYQISSFKIFSNIEEEITPYLPVKPINYEIIKFNEGISPKNQVFFGCATPKVKSSIFNFFNTKHSIAEDRYLKIIHPSSYVAKSSIIENGTLIEPNCVISSQSKIGFGVFIKRGTCIGHHNSIGDFCDINPGVTLSGKVSIGNNCIIGSGTVIKDNITIGENTIIGIGSVLTKNIPSNCIAYGNPCKVMKTL